MDETNNQESKNLNETSSATQINLPTEPKLNNKPSNKWFYISAVVFLLLVLSFRIGYISGQGGLAFDSKQFKVVGDTAQGMDFSLLSEAIDTVANKFIDRENIDKEKVLYGAIRGAVSSAGDDYTEFFDPKTFADFKTELQGTFEGIGAEIGRRKDNIIVVAPLDGSPAEKAGLRAKDIILQVNGVSMLDKTTNEAVRNIRGEKGTEVTLTIFREGRDSAFDIKIIRETIEVKSVKVEFKEQSGKQIAIISISRFGDDTEELFKQAVLDVKSKNVAGIVVDLRNNPGGYLETSVRIASHWLEVGQLVVKEARSEKDAFDYTSDGTNEFGNTKTVVLINGGSASASEILAGALRDHGKATLVGEKSFGKGSVQELVSLTGGSAVKVTIAKWITPNGINLNNGGLDPDIKVELTEDDANADRDPQLAKALEEVSK